MTARECRSCTLWLMPDEFSVARPNYCHECERARPVVIRVAGIAANALIKCRAASALLNLGYVYAARLVLAGAEDWPSARELRGVVVTRKKLWVMLDEDTLEMVRNLLQQVPPPRDPLPAAA